MKTSNNTKTGEASLKFFEADEAGNAALFGILGMTAIFFLFKYGDIYLKDINPIIYGSIVALVSTVSLFCMGCSIHLRALGDRPTRHLVKELRNRIREFETLAAESNERIRDTESRMIARASIMTRRGTDCLGLVKKIVRAIEKRNFDAGQLLSSGNRADFIDAYELVSRKLVVAESALDILLDADPIPPMDNCELFPVIDRLLQEIESEIKKAA